MATDNGLASAAVLAVTLGAVYLLLNERKSPDMETKDVSPDWRTLDPGFSAGGFEDPRSGAATLRPRKKERAVVDPLDFTPDIKAHVERLRDGVGDQTGNVGAVLEIERRCRRFAMLVFRRMGRSPGETSGLDSARAAGDLTRIRAEVVNAVQALYISVHRERMRRVLDEVTDGFMRDSASYIRAVRQFGGSSSRNLYEGGRGFPSPWDEAADPDYDMI